MPRSEDTGWSKPQLNLVLTRLFEYMEQRLHALVYPNKLSKTDVVENDIQG